MAGFTSRKKKKQTNYFGQSAIVPQEFSPVKGVPNNKRGPLRGRPKPKASKEGHPYSYAHITKDGKLYSIQAYKIRTQLPSLDLNRKRRDTIMAFCKNWYIAKKTLPSMRTLRRLFQLPKK